MWLLDPDARTLAILELDGPTYRLLATHAGNDVVPGVPFNEIELELSGLWGD